MIRVFVVHEFRLMCNIISAAIQDEPDIIVVGSATSIEEAIEWVDQEPLDVVLLSSRLPHYGSIKLARMIAQMHSGMKVLVLGITETKEGVLQYIESGAAGYVHRDNSVEELMTAIRAAHEGKALISTEIAAVLIERVSKLARSFSNVSDFPVETISLTKRQIEILELLALNYTNQQIAERLSIEIGTVKNHIHNIFSRLGVTNRADAAELLSLIKEKSQSIE
ncbi:MAG: response regulator transcription factor [Anaerolineales bacterium]|nr:response regulator transcription factor [Anaerolineales bacterium]